MKRNMFTVTLFVSGGRNPFVCFNYDNNVLIRAAPIETQQDQNGSMNRREDYT